MVIQILIEGPDGVGKTTLADSLIKHINAGTKYKAICIQEPNSLIFGLRDIAKNGITRKANTADVALGRVTMYGSCGSTTEPCTEATICLMMASMAQSHAYVQALEAELKEKNLELIVIYDRSIISTLLYQALRRGKFSMVTTIWTLFTSLIKTRYDAVIVLNGEPDVFAKRFKSDCDFDKQNKLMTKLYRQAEHLFGSTYHKLPPPRTEQEKDAIIKMMLPSHRQEYTQTFTNWLHIDTSQLDHKQTLAAALEHLSKIDPKAFIK